MYGSILKKYLVEPRTLPEQETEQTDAVAIAAQMREKLAAQRAEKEAAEKAEAEAAAKAEQQRVEG